VVAYHESGHALVQSLLPDADPVHKVSIIPRMHMGGATFSLPEKDRTVYTKKYLLSVIQVCFGGRVAEEIACGDVSSGAQADIQQATDIARRMVTEWGMSEKLGFVAYNSDQGQPGFEFMQREYSDQTAQVIDSEIQAIMQEAYKNVKQLLETHREPLDHLKEALVRYETLDGEEVRRIMKGQALDRPTVGDLLEAEQQRPPRRVKPERAEEEPGFGGALPQPG
jgi:cell division protease FtsH